jgi:hypothetical protein
MAVACSQSRASFSSFGPARVSLQYFALGIVVGYRDSSARETPISKGMNDIECCSLTVVSIARRCFRRQNKAVDV